MIELTEEQRQQLREREPIAVDPSTKEIYVLVRKNVYDRINVYDCIKGLLYDDGEGSHDELRLLLARSAAEHGWNEPGMEDYDQYDANRAKACP